MVFLTLVLVNGIFRAVLLSLYLGQIIEVPFFLLKKASISLLRVTPTGEQL
jgi:hypothetical protein